MDYEGKSIQEQTTDPSTPAILAAIAVLQAEVVTLEAESTAAHEQILFIQGQITLLKDDAKTQGLDITRLQDEEKKIESLLGDIESKQASMQTNLSILQTQMVSVSDAVSTIQAITADTASVVLTCPVSDILSNCRNVC